MIEIKTSESPLEGIKTWKNDKNGFTIIDLEYTADPRKRSEEWLAQTRAGMPRAEFEREYGKRWIAYDGKPVYQDYDETIHMLSGAILAGKRFRLISGWDGGPNDVNLAWVLGLVIPSETAVLWIDEYCVDDGDVEDFVQVVGVRLKLEWVKLGGFSIHVADQSVFTKTQLVKDGKAMADIMRAHGMPPIPGEISFAKRRVAVEDKLMDLYKSTTEGRAIPKWRTHERCEQLREGMAGGYAYPKVAGGVGGDYKPTPMKNRFSHICNAMEYATTRLGIATFEIPYENRALPYVSVI